MKRYRLKQSRKQTYIEILVFTSIVIVGGLLNTIFGI